MAINFGDILGGLGAAYGGRAQEYAEGIRQREQGLTEQKRAELEARQRAMYEDADTALRFLTENPEDPRITRQMRANSVIQLAEDRLDALSSYPDADPSDTLQILRDAQAMRDQDDPMAINRLMTTLFPAASIYRQRFAPQQQDETVVINGRLVNKRTGEVVFESPPETPQEPAAVQSLRIRAAESGLIPSTPEYSDFMRSGGGGTGVNVTTNVQAPGADKYIEERAKAQATSMTELEKSAESAYRANQALSRFIESSASGDSGGAQPLITNVKNFLSSFGFDPAGLTDTAIMQQAVGDILGAKMAELGARGLTDKDMQILRDALPQVNTSHQARVAVADIIKRANDNTLREYDSQVMFEEQTYPDMNFRRPSWAAGLRGQLQKAYAPQDWLDSGLTQQDWDALPDNEKQVFLEGN